MSAAFWVMVALQSMGSVDMPGSGPRKMPAPRSYVAIIVLFSTLHLVADAGAERAAGAMAWVTVLVGIVKGPFGDKLSNFFNTVADNFGIQPPPGQQTSTVPYPQPIQPLQTAG